MEGVESQRGVRNARVREHPAGSPPDLFSAAALSHPRVALLAVRDAGAASHEAVDRPSAVRAAERSALGGERLRTRALVRRSNSAVGRRPLEGHSESGSSGGIRRQKATSSGLLLSVPIAASLSAEWTYCVIQEERPFWGEATSVFGVEQCPSGAPSHADTFPSLAVALANRGFCSCVLTEAVHALRRHSDERRGWKSRLPFPDAPARPRVTTADTPTTSSSSSIPRLNSPGASRGGLAHNARREEAAAAAA
ncbi:unnamed protein product [Lampetra planeri]